MKVCDWKMCFSPPTHLCDSHQIQEVGVFNLWRCDTAEPECEHGSILVILFWGHFMLLICLFMLWRMSSRVWVQHSSASEEELHVLHLDQAACIALGEHLSWRLFFLNEWPITSMNIAHLVNLFIQQIHLRHREIWGYLYYEYYHFMLLYNSASPYISDRNNLLTDKHNYILGHI